MSHLVANEDNINTAESTNLKKPGEEYRKYLDREGTIDVIKKVLSQLYDEPEWPVNPTEYVCVKMAELSDISLLDKLEINLKEKVKNLEQANSKLEEELKKLKTEKK